MTPQVIYGADLFAGAGGTSTGLIEACQELNLNLELVAVNHWEKAIRTHEANYPWARHLQADVEAVNPLEAIPGGHLDILVASPECTHFSRAAGGRPRNEQRRSSAWSIFRWLEMLNVDRVLVENVPDFLSWGPLDCKGYPVKLRRGEIFQTWLRAFKAHGYTVSFKVLNAADFGAYTSRNRLFIMAVRGKSRPVFPTATHSRQGWPVKKWLPAKEIIDWSIKGESIFSRKKPLSARTVKRIIEGCRKFGGPELKPFLILMEHHGGVKSLDEPVPTITCAKGGAMALVDPEPFAVAMENVNREGPKVKSVNDPLWTITAKGNIGVAQPFILSYHAGKECKDSRISPVESPLGTLDTSNRYAVAEPFLTPNFGEHEGQSPRCHSVDDPLPAVTSHGAGNLVEPFILPVEGFYRDNQPKSVKEPLNTITQRGGGCVVEPFLVEYYGNGSVDSVKMPLGTVTTRDRFGLVQPEINGKRLDIRFRMLQPKELAAATGFPVDYKFLGTKTDVVRQIGNAVVVPMSKALCMALLKKKLEGSA